MMLEVGVLGGKHYSLLAKVCSCKATQFTHNLNNNLLKSSAVALNFPEFL